MTRLCYISRNYKGLKAAGDKAKTDNEDTLQQLGAVNLGLKRTGYTNKCAAFCRNLAGVLVACCRMRRGDLILLQYPVKKYFTFICRVAHLRGARTVALIHDLGSFRRKRLTIEQEINRLMAADHVIASNDVMAEWLHQHGYAHPLSALGLFDYRSSAHNLHTTAEAFTQRLPQVVYAGALGMRKNAFLLQAHEHINGFELNIYGNRAGLPGLEDSSHIHLHEFLPADEFIRTIDADFGLVWDGDSCDECTGNFGEYLRYNSPHKVSFYLRAALPIIIWRHAALASLIEREQLGICISSIRELAAAIRSITPQQYAQMKANASLWAQRLDSGQSLQQALANV